LKEFFLNLKTAMRTQLPISQVDQKWNASDRDLHKQVIGTQDVVHRALLNNLDYPKAMEVIFGMWLRSEGVPCDLCHQHIASHHGWIDCFVLCCVGLCTRVSFSPTN
jgi:hypothetical protein